MTDIPEDVMGEAWNCWRTMGFVNDRLGMTPILAEALLAAEKRGEQRERARCAGIAERIDGYVNPADSAIAAAIRNGDPQ